MRFSKWLLSGAVAALATFAAAQDAPPPDETPPAGKAQPGLQGLDETVDQLLREENQPPVEAPVQTPANEQPVTEQPAEQPATEQPATEPPAAETPPAESQPPAETPASPPPPPPAAAAEPSAPPPLTRAQIATLDRTVERGRLLIEIARAGIVATQDMLTRVSDPSGAGIAGWIAEPGGNSILVTFYANGSEGSAPNAVYRANVLGTRVTSREVFLGDDRPVLTPPQARMAAARMASESDELHACGTQTFNALIIPPASPRAPIDVYRISPPSQRGRFPLGGHFRSTVAVGGAVETHAFAEGCREVDVPAAATGQQPRPIGVSEITDAMPTEVHMLLAQEIGRPLLVVAGDPRRVWLVTGDRIAEARGVVAR